VGVPEKCGAGEGNRTPDLRFTKPNPATDSKEDQQLTSAKREQIRQNPQPGRNQDSPIVLSIIAKALLFAGLAREEKPHTVNDRPSEDEPKRGGT
jgi:hypothetical protein